MKRSFAVLVATVVATAATLVALDPAGAAPPGVVTAGADWIVTQQQSDGGFEVSGFPGFETPDAVLAIAEAAQTTSTWSTAEALAAVESHTVGGKDALDALDDLVDADISVAQAAKLIVLDLAPLGLSASDFDPSGDTAAAVDLRAQVLGAAGGDGSYSSIPAFNGKLYAALALDVLGLPVPAALASAIEAAQQADGFWSYTGNPADTDVDVDTTALALQALAAAGQDMTDPAVADGVLALEDAQQANGAWQAFGSDDPNSTAVAILAIRAVGGDVGSTCWRDAADPADAPLPYVDPTTWLASQAAADHHIVSPNDGFGVNTFATSQAIQALGGLWLPVAAAAPVDCPAATANVAFVRRAYTDVLGRPADSGGLVFHANRILDGASRASVPRALTRSAEHRRKAIDETYQAVLGRDATPAEHATDDATIGRPYDQAIAVPARLFGQVGGSDAAWLGTLYSTVLHRAPDTAGQQQWLTALGAGRSRASVARAVLASGEARGVVVMSIYEHYLDRAADPTGLAFWRGRLVAGASVESVIVAVVGSTEYAAQAQPV